MNSDLSDKLKAVQAKHAADRRHKIHIAFLDLAARVNALDTGDSDVTDEQIAKEMLDIEMRARVIKLLAREQ